MELTCPKSFKTCIWEKEDKSPNISTSILAVFPMCMTTHRMSHPQQGQIPHWFANNYCMSESHPLMCCDIRISARFNKYQSRNKIPILTQNRPSEKKTVLMTIDQYRWCALWCWNNLGMSIPCKIWNQVFVAEHIPHLKTRVLFSVSSRQLEKMFPIKSSWGGTKEKSSVCPVIWQPSNKELLLTEGKW